MLTYAYILIIKNKNLKKQDTLQLKKQRFLN